MADELDFDDLPAAEVHAMTDDDTEDVEIIDETNAHTSSAADMDLEEEEEVEPVSETHAYTPAYDSMPEPAHEAAVPVMSAMPDPEENNALT
jgi:hypothetical protein